MDFNPNHPTNLWKDPFVILASMHVKRCISFCGWSTCLSALRGKLTQLCSGLIDFHVTESQTVLNVSKGEATPTRVDAHVNRVPEGKAKSPPTHGKEWTIGGLGIGICLSLLKDPHVSFYHCLPCSFLSFPVVSLCLFIHLFIQQTTQSSTLLWVIQRHIAFMEVPSLFWILSEWVKIATKTQIIYFLFSKYSSNKLPVILVWERKWYL